MDFETVYRNHHQKLYTLAFRLTGNREDAEDVLQTSFLNAYKAYGQFVGKSSVYTWLYRIVLNTSKKYLKEAARLPSDVYAEEQGQPLQQVYNHINSFGRTEDEVLIKATRETCLQMFVNCLPPDYRAVYTLRIMLRFSTAETAEILEMTESAVKVNLHRARQKAWDHIDGRCSLIREGSLCDCRSYAGYIERNNRRELLADIKTVRNREKAAAERYENEMKQIFDIDDLYDNQVAAPDPEAFLRQVKKLTQEKRLRILGA